MPKKPTRSKLVKKLDTVFSQWVRLSNADNNKNCICVTCNKTFFWKEIQAGHFISRKHYSTRWDERNVLPQCAGCNIFRAGEQYKYSLYLGNKLSKKLLEESRKLVKFTNVELEEMIQKYSQRLKKFT